MTIQSYLDTLNRRYKTGISREHTYRGDLQTLLMTILPDILVTNEPARVACGAPDYMLTRKINKSSNLTNFSTLIRGSNTLSTWALDTMGSYTRLTTITAFSSFRDYAFRYWTLGTE
jgi:hypothetical protein